MFIEVETLVLVFKLITTWHYLGLCHSQQSDDEQLFVALCILFVC